jgi:hypothetical protein
LIAIKALVIGAFPLESAIPGARRTTGRGFRDVAGPRRTPEWSGQRMPTGAKVAQSAQIGRPHSEQANPVSRSGCR